MPELPDPEAQFYDDFGKRRPSEADDEGLSEFVVGSGMSAFARQFGPWFPELIGRFWGICAGRNGIAFSYPFSAMSPLSPPRHIDKDIPLGPIYRQGGYYIYSGGDLIRAANHINENSVTLYGGFGLERLAESLPSEDSDDLDVIVRKAMFRYLYVL